MDLYYRKTGRGGPLFILHGLFGSSDNWMSIAKVLSPHYTVYLPDQRNHGASSWSEDWNYEVMASDIKLIVEKERLQEICVLGHSMGGKVAMELAIRYPGLVRKIMVVDIAPRHYPVRHRDILDGLKSINLDTISKRKEADDQLSRFISAPHIRNFLLKNIDRDENGKFKWKINLEVINRNIAEAGEGQTVSRPVEIPSLFVRGANSDYIKDGDLDHIHRLFPQASVVTIDNAGHWLHAEQPMIFTQIVKDFFNC